MPIESYVGCLDCLQHSDYDCKEWCIYVAPRAVEERKEGVIQMERTGDGFVRVYCSRIQHWVLGKLDSNSWIDWRYKRDIPFKN